jgi:DNA-binding NarL/FixJ family response regulator
MTSGFCSTLSSGPSARPRRSAWRRGGEEGIRLLEEHSDVDVVFCDLLMPRVSGMEVYQWVCEHRPDLVDRFVILTAGANDDKYREFLQTTRLPVIHKPFSVHEVQETINRCARRPKSGTVARPAASPVVGAHAAVAFRLGKGRRCGRRRRR